MKYFFDPQIVINIARKEVGYREKKSNKDLDDPTANAGDKNYTKYARDMDALGDFYNGRKQGICGWCDIFVDWCFVQAYGVTEGRELLCQPLRSCGAGPYYSMQYFKARKQLRTMPEPGDQIFFLPSSGGDKPSHTGLVVDVDDKYVYTIEGNTSANGITGCAAAKSYLLTNTRIAGYGHPDWGEMPDEEPAENTGEDPDTVENVVSLYALPDDDSEIVAKQDGELLIVALATNGWYGVWHDGRICWVHPDNVGVFPIGADAV